MCYDEIDVFWCALALIRKKIYGLHKKTKPSSQKWLLRHLNDPYVHKARDLGYRCRSAFKLADIHQKYPVITSGMRVLDLGCAPGGWCQWALKAVGQSGYVMGVDLLPIEPLPGLLFVQGDITETCVQERMGTMIRQSHGSETSDIKFDVIISDMAPSLSGHTGTDRLKMEALLTSVWTVAQQWLRIGGHMIVKVYHGDMMAVATPFFKVKKYIKPPSSRPESREIYWVGQGFKGLESPAKSPQCDDAGERWHHAPGDQKNHQTDDPKRAPPSRQHHDQLAPWTSSKEASERSSSGQ